MRIIKVALAGGLATLGVGVLVTAYGALDESFRWLGLGIALGFTGTLAIAVGTVLVDRRQLQRLDQLRQVLGHGSSDFNTAIRNEVDEVVRVVDARILGLFEELTRSRRESSDPESR